MLASRLLKLDLVVLETRAFDSSQISGHWCGESRSQTLSGLLDNFYGTAKSFGLYSDDEFENRGLLRYMLEV